MAYTFNGLGTSYYGQGEPGPDNRVGRLRLRAVRSVAVVPGAPDRRGTLGVVRGGIHLFAVPRPARAAQLPAASPGGIVILPRKTPRRKNVSRPMPWTSLGPHRIPNANTAWLGHDRIGASAGKRA
jgi:hypothetical protein